MYVSSVHGYLLAAGAVVAADGPGALAAVAGAIRPVGAGEGKTALPAI